MKAIGFIGLGLIGGSIAKAIKQYDNSIQLTAYDINEASLQQALLDKTLDTIAPAIDDSFSNCDILFLCAPVSCNDENLHSVKKVLSPNCILTDVGSVKTTIHAEIDALGLSSSFIGGHPMAGSERIGYVNSKAQLLENAYYILTPTKEVSPSKVTFMKEFVQKLGALPLILDCQKHDYVTAAISHLPHVIASSLVQLVKDSDSSDGIMKLVAAGGFKDITRIASSSPAMWQQICLTNTENISSLLEDYITSLQKIKNNLDAKKEKELYQLFDESRIYRDSFLDTSSGPIKKAYDIRIDIADRAGALAPIATLLAEHNISIKNIGIVHNRESQDGVLRIEFHEEASVQDAKKLLMNQGYTLYEKA